MINPTCAPACGRKFASIPEYMKKFARRPTITYMFLPETEPPCNSRCTGCFVLSGGAYKKRIKRTEEAIIVDLLRFRKAGFSVFASTTEVLRFRRLAEILKASASTSVLTNGRVLVEKSDLCEEIRDIGIRQVVLTANFENSGLRLTSSDIVREAARRVVASGLELMMRITITQRNLDFVPQMAEECICQGAQVVQFLRYLRINGKGPQMLTEQETGNFFGMLDELRIRYPAIYLSAAGSLGTQFRKKQFCCGAGSRDGGLTIGVDGNIYPCIYLTQPENAIGRYEDGELVREREFSSKGNPLDCPAYHYLSRSAREKTEKQKGGI